MKIVSLVPSWTETLLECDVEVVGRTRFCLHPQNAVSQIPIVGGTKSCDWEKIKALNPDLVLFDKEENLKEMAEACPFPFFSTHVESIQSLPRELAQLADRLENLELRNLSERCNSLLNRKKIVNSGIPGVVEWLRPNNKSEVAPKVAYIIWKNPWMAAGRNTFIGSLLEVFGLHNYFVSEKYPKFEMSELPADLTLLFSSEPFPFQAKKPDLAKIPNPMALVDGEKYAWFGIRSIRFLESLVQTKVE